MEDMKVPLHIEVEMTPESLISHDSVETALRHKFKKSFPIFREGPILIPPDDPLHNDIVRVMICDLGGQEVPFWKAELLFYIYRNIEGDPEKDYLEGEEELPACDQWELPNQALSRLWESIVVEDHIKTDILGYATSAMIFTSAMIDPDIISWNRMILLHGPPGSGKTTLCKAIAQKVYVRNMSDYDSGFLLEINSHSLFSKWFSESGKLVMKLFDHINEIADDPKSFVCILIDEVESITSNRSSSMSSNEPGDAVRVVNAVLTSLDALKRRPNVLVLCTSNMQEAIDPAFRDRVDLQVYLGPPSLAARYSILRSCLQELSLKQLISPPCALAALTHLPLPATRPARVSGVETGAGAGTVARKPTNQLEQWAQEGITQEEQEQEQEGGSGLMDTDSNRTEHNSDYSASPSSPPSFPSSFSSASLEGKLLHIAEQCNGYSGRSLRKLPLKAHAMCLQRKRVSMEQYLNAIATTIDIDAKHNI